MAKRLLYSRTSLTNPRRDITQTRMETREIKFRAYIRGEGMMLFPNWQFITDGTNIYILDPHSEESKYIVWNRQFEIMQFTGLKDKNGVEIYEGDVVEFWGGIGLIVYDHHGFAIKWQNELFDPLEENKLIILGNIHEHPNLIP